MLPIRLTEIFLSQIQLLGKIYLLNILYTDTSVHPLALVGNYFTFPNNLKELIRREVTV